jgi:CheY-like chemotaxis protein
MEAKPIRILMIDDSPVERELLPRLLRRLGHCVTTAACAQDAREVASRDQFDLVISDIELPDGNGWDLMREFKTQRPVKAVAVSGLSAPEDMGRSRDAGFAAHLVKPVDMPRLQSLIRQLAA